MTEVSIKVSEAASTYIKKMLAKDNKNGVECGFRLSVKKTGCSGYSYVPALVEAPVAGDVLIKQVEFNLYIDKAWQTLLNGLCIDYLEEEKQGLKQKRLVFTNPQEANRCGCGESFHIEKE